MLPIGVMMFAVCRLKNLDVLLVRPNVVADMVVRGPLIGHVTSVGGLWTSGLLHD